MSTTTLPAGPASTALPWSTSSLGQPSSVAQSDLASVLSTRKSTSKLPLRPSAKPQRSQNARDRSADRNHFWPISCLSARLGPLRQRQCFLVPPGDRAAPYPALPDERPRKTPRNSTNTPRAIRSSGHIMSQPTKSSSPKARRRAAKNRVPPTALR